MIFVVLELYFEIYWNWFDFWAFLSCDNWWFPLWYLNWSFIFWICGLDWDRGLCGWDLFSFSVLVLLCLLLIITVGGFWVLELFLLTELVYLFLFSFFCIFFKLFRFIFSFLVSLTLFELFLLDITTICSSFYYYYY